MSIADHGEIAAGSLLESGSRQVQNPVKRPNVARKGRPSVAVKILQTKNEKESARVLKQVLRIAWTDSHGQKRTDTLTLQPSWRVDEEQKPYAETWRMEETHVLLLMIYASNSGTFEVSAPLLCRLTSSRCLPLAKDISPYSFSNYGSFYLQGKRLYVWDAIHEGADDASKYRYDLRTFVWKSGRYRLISRRSTHRAYQPFLAGAGPGANLNPAEDPLKEFGLRWHWGMLNHSAP